MNCLVRCLVSAIVLGSLAATASAQEGPAGTPTVASETHAEASLPPTSMRIGGTVLDVGCVVIGAVRSGDRLFVSCPGGRIRGFVAGTSGAFTLAEEWRAPGEISALFRAEGVVWVLSDGQAASVEELPTVEISAAALARPGADGSEASARAEAPGAASQITVAASDPLASGTTGVRAGVVAGTRSTASATVPARVARAVEPAATAPHHFALHDRQGRTLVDTRHESQPDRGLWGAGVGLFIAGWVLDIAGTAIFNAVSNDRSNAQEQDAQAWSLLPFVGPFIQLGVEAPHPALPITSGLLQITGCVLFVLGMTSFHDAEIPIYVWGDPHDVRTARLGLDVSPTEGGGYATLTLHAM